MCKKCSTGGLCKKCLNSLPPEYRAKYIRRHTTPIVIGVTIFIIIVGGLSVINIAAGLFVGLFGLCAFSIDHGKNKVTRRWELSLASKIYTQSLSGSGGNVARNNWNPASPGGNQKTTFNFEDDQKKHKKSNSGSKTGRYTGTFWQD